MSTSTDAEKLDVLAASDEHIPGIVQRANANWANDVTDVRYLLSKCASLFAQVQEMQDLLREERCRSVQMTREWK